MSPGRSQSSVEKTPADVVDANLLAAREAEISQDFRLAALNRLHDMVGDADAKAQLTARFHLVDGKVAIAGTVFAPLHLKCQRCLKPMVLPVDDEFHVVLAASEVEISELPSAQDAVIADSTRLDLAWLTEEQLLLARPLAPMHADTAECKRKQTSTAAEQSRDPVAERGAESGAESGAETQHPFAGLRDLLNRRS